MVLTYFSLQNSLGKILFFKKTFLLANTSMEVILRMPFLFVNNINVEFAELEKLTWRLYMAVEALPTTNWIKLIGKREFAKAALDGNYKIFVMHITTLKVLIVILIHPSRAFQV